MENKVCRICYGGDSERKERHQGKDLSKTINENPLLSACECTGSQRYVHYECLIRWIEGEKVEMESDQATNHVFMINSCELCHA